MVLGAAWLRSGLCVLVATGHQVAQEPQIGGQDPKQQGSGTRRPTFGGTLDVVGGVSDRWPEQRRSCSLQARLWSTLEAKRL